MNLWELLTHVESNNGYKSKEARKTIIALEATGRYGQELSIEIYDEGWLIRIFSCYDDHVREIRIPTNIKKPSMETTINA